MNHPASSSVPCPECGKPLPTATAGQPRPVCPACLLAQALVSGTAFDPAATPSSATANPPPPPPTPEQIADKFPQFEILACLGRGGMGVVYKARQKSLNRLVALKILAPERERDARFAERFAREAELLAKLSHPHIVTIHDFGETAGLFYIVMEFVDGVNLRDLIREGKLEARQALAIVPPICEALQYAHEKGVVHRDIKPENLLLDREGRVKIADFGIAALVGSGDGAGERAGTPPYMAPEQGDARREVDHRADIYALGVVLYEMLTGERPAKDLVAPSRKVQIDVRLDEIVLRALEKSPSLRYQTAGEFRTQVEATLTAPPTEVAQASSLHSETPPTRPAPVPSDAAASRTPPPAAPALLKSTAARVAWPAPATAVGSRAESAPLINPSVGSVELHTDRLIVRSGAETREVPLAALTACGEALPPAWFSPAGHRYAGVEFTDPDTGQRQRLVFQPGTPLFVLPGTTALRAAEWLAALRAAHQAATGRELPVWPAPWVFRLHGGPRILRFILFANLSCLLVLLLFINSPLGLTEIALLVLFNPLTFALGILGGVLALRAWSLRHRPAEVAQASSLPSAPPPPAPASQPPAAPPRFSVTAILGACCAGLFFFTALDFVIDAIVEQTVAHHDFSLAPPSPPPAFVGWITVVKSLLALTSVPGTTLLGWIAVWRIRRSEGRLRGLRLAVFDGLLFPLLALDATALVPLVRVLHRALSHGTATAALWTAAAVALLALVAANVLLVGWVWRAVKSRVRGAPAAPAAARAPLPGWTGFAALLGGLVLATALVTLVNSHARHQPGAWEPQRLSRAASPAITEPYASLRVDNISREGRVVIFTLRSEPGFPAHELTLRYHGDPLPPPHPPAVFNLTAALVPALDQAPEGNVIHGTGTLRGPSDSLWRCGFVLPDEHLAEMVVQQARPLHSGQSYPLGHDNNVLLLFLLAKREGLDPDDRPVLRQLSGQLSVAPAAPTELPGDAFEAVVERTLPLGGIPGEIPAWLNLETGFISSTPPGLGVWRDGPEYNFWVTGQIYLTDYSEAYFDAADAAALQRHVQASHRAYLEKHGPLPGTGGGLRLRTPRPATYAFVTEGGRVGLLETTSVNENQPLPGLKIRYKLVRRAVAPAAPAADSPPVPGTITERSARPPEHRPVFLDFETGAWRTAPSRVPMSAADRARWMAARGLDLCVEAASPTAFFEVSLLGCTIHPIGGGGGMDGLIHGPALHPDQVQDGWGKSLRQIGEALPEPAADTVSRLQGRSPFGILVRTRHGLIALDLTCPEQDPARVDFRYVILPPPSGAPVNPTAIRSATVEN